MVLERARENHSRSLSRPRLWIANDSGCPVIVPEQPAEPRIAAYLTFIKRWGGANDRLVPESLVRTLVEVVFDILAD